MSRQPVRAGAFLALAMLALLASACAPARCPQAGGPVWRELATPHFRVKTDLPEGEARTAVGGFETKYAELVSAAFRGVDTTRPFDVLLLRDDDEFHDWVSTNFAGFYMSRFPLDLERSPTITFYAGGDARARAAAQVVFLHELTHRFIARAFLPVPPWLNEGLAEYYSSMSVAEGRVTFGDMPLTMQLATPDRPVPIRDLLNAEPAQFYVPDASSTSAREVRTGNYESAWAFIHFLKNGPTPYSRRFSTFLHLLRAEPRETVAVAWSKAFGDVPEAALEDAYRDYVELPSWKTYSHLLTAPPPPPAPTVRTMTDAEVHVVRARLLSAEHSPARVAEELQLLQAHGEKMGEADYWFGALDLVMKQPGAAHDRFVRALAGAPTDPRLGYADILASRRILAAKSAPAIPDQARLRARLTSLLDSLTERAAGVEELAVAAEYAAELGQLPRAEQLAGRALAEDPDAPIAHAANALVLFRAESLDGAVLEQTRAIELAGRDGVRMAPLLAEYRAARDRAHVKAPVAPPRPTSP